MIYSQMGEWVWSSLYASDYVVQYVVLSNRYPLFDVPFAFDMNRSPVTAIDYCGNCPDDFVAELQSVLTKLPHKLKSTRVCF